MQEFTWVCGPHTFHIGRKPLILGIVNVTPDSFSDGGQHANADAAIRHGMKLSEDGADILDIGGESTRPGATPVNEREELERVLPVVAELVRLTKLPVSIDTMKPGVAKACLEAGAVIVNDVAGLRDPEMANVVRESGAGAIVMHMQGTPQTMQLNPQYADAVRDVNDFFAERLATLTAAGIPAERIAFDPGIGFGKTQEHTLQLLAHLKELGQGRPVCLGVSRKGFLGLITGRARRERDGASAAIACFAMAAGAAQILRVHDVPGIADAVKLWDALRPT